MDAMTLEHNVEETNTTNVSLIIKLTFWSFRYHSNRSQSKEMS